MASLIFLGFSCIAFLISYGTLFMIMPIVFGVLFGVLDGVNIPTQEWEDVYHKNQDLAKFLTPLAATIGIFIFIMKVGMNASAKGSD